MHRHRIDRPLALDRGYEDERQTELCVVQVRPTPPCWSSLSRAWFGVRVIASQAVCPMQQDISATTFRLQVLWRCLQAACSPREISRDTSVTPAGESNPKGGGLRYSHASCHARRFQCAEDFWRS